MSDSKNVEKEKNMSNKGINIEQKNQNNANNNIQNIKKTNSNINFPNGQSKNGNLKNVNKPNSQVNINNKSQKQVNMVNNVNPNNKIIQTNRSQNNKTAQNNKMNQKNITIQNNKVGQNNNGNKANSEVQKNKEVKNNTTNVKNVSISTKQPESIKVIEKKETSPVVVNKKTEIATEGKDKNKKKHIFKIVSITILSIILVLLITFLIFAYVMSSSIKIHSGISIKDVDVSNLDKQTATESVNTYIQNRLPEEIVLVHGDYEATLNTEELNIKFNVDEAINNAYSIGRGQNIFTDGFEILSTMISNKRIEPKFSLDEEILTNMLEDISTKLPDKVIDSGFYIDGKNLIINKGKDGVVIDIDKMKKVVKDKIYNLNVLNTRIEIVTKDASPSEIDLDKVYKKVHKEAINAKFTEKPMSVTPSENGIDFAISLEEAKEKLNEDNQECVIPLKVVYPEVTTNMIGTEAFPDRLAIFSTYYPASNYNRTTNLILASNKINGTVLMPGETFSYNQVVGERSIAAGYKEAPIYVNGKVEDGLGGGICQIATTLYNAVVYADLEVVERANHQFVPSYVGAGRDATVVYGAIDFKFKNNRNYPIKIISSVGGGVATFQILGLGTENDREIEIYSRITSQTANSTNSETYKIIKSNGEVIDRILLSRDYYKRH